MKIQSISDIEQIEKTPLDQHSLPKNTYDIIKNAAANSPNQKALTFFLDGENFKETKSWTYDEFLKSIHQFANGLHSIGIKKNDVVAFVLPNIPETHFAIWGTEATGIVLAINPLLDGEQIVQLLQTANVKALITLSPTPGSDLWQKLEPHLHKVAQLSSIILVRLNPYVGLFQKIALSILGAAYHFKWSLFNASKAKWIDSLQLMNSQPTDRLISGRTILPGDRSSYFCTGGTTGLPKIAIRTHANEVFNAWSVSKMGDQSDQTKSEVFFCGLPLFHVNGQLVTGLVPFLRGAEIILASPQGYRGTGVVKNFWAMVDYFKITGFSGVPTAFAALLKQPMTGHDISSLEYAVCGAAPMPVTLFKEFESKANMQIREGYGLTEGTCVSSANPPAGERRIGSIGLRIPYQHMRTVILDSKGDYLKDADVDEEGLVVLYGPNVFQGYLEPDHNKGLWVEIDGRKWLNTGDLGRRDSDQYFWLTGRKKELIIRGGHNIDPKAIEEALQSHPSVLLCAAIGSPDAYAGEVPVAYVQLRPRLEATNEQLLEYAKQKIQEKAAVPKRVVILPELPLTAVGKIFKPALTQLEIEHVVRAEAQMHHIQIEKLEVKQEKSKGFVAKIYLNAAHPEFQKSMGKFTFQTEWITRN